MSSKIINVNHIFAIIILLLSLVEFIVYNEEIFLFLCFFLFACLISSGFSSHISEGLVEESKAIEKEFLASSYSVRNEILAILNIKKGAISSINKASLIIRLNVIHMYQIAFFSDFFWFGFLYERTLRDLFITQAIYNNQISWSDRNQVNKIFEAVSKNVFSKKLIKI